MTFDRDYGELIFRRALPLRDCIQAVYAAAARVVQLNEQMMAALPRWSLAPLFY